MQSSGGLPVNFEKGLGHVSLNLKIGILRLLAQREAGEVRTRKYY